MTADPAPPRRGRALRALRWMVAPTLLLGGCALGPGPTTAGVRLTVTADFGRHQLRALGSPRVQGQDTVMRLLERNVRVQTRYGGGFVQSIDGHGGGQTGGRPVDWFYYVNGLEAPAGAADTRLHAGDRVWWDRHDWGAAQSTSAVVGSYPEPFLHGSGGRRLPVRVECDSSVERACRIVADRLSALGVPAGQARPGTAAAGPVLRVLVGAWTAVRRDPLAVRLEQGPGTSGVYVRPARSGHTLALLDQTGRVAQVLGPRAGLVAAIRSGDQRPVWLITGTDAAGVDAAARALDEHELRDRFAVVAAPGGILPAPAAASVQVRTGHR